MRRRAHLAAVAAAAIGIALYAGLRALAGGAGGIGGEIVAAFAALAAAAAAARRLAGRAAKPLERYDPERPDDAGIRELAGLSRRYRDLLREAEREAGVARGRAEALDAVAENMREGLLVLRREGAVAYANEAAARILGGPATLGEDVSRACRDADFLRAVRRALRGEASEARLARGGESYGVYASPTRGEGGATVFLVNETERLKAERQRAEFSANVSHELKTPLTTIAALAELIEGGIAKPEDIAGFAAKISAQAARLRATIEDIMRLSAFDEGAARLNRERFELIDLASEILEAHRDRADRKGVRLRIEGGGTEAFADRALIGELIGNLVENAIRYSREGGEVRVEIAEEGEFAIIAVRDEGVGIEADRLPRIFERFYRADPSRDRRTGGTGLGLAIVKHIAECHGGSAEIRSEFGAGTEVVARIARGEGAGG